MEAPDHDIDALRRDYIALRPSYERLVTEVMHVLNGRLEKSDSVTLVSVSGRAKNLDRVVAKISRKKYKNPLTEITDLAGVRVVCSYESDLEIVSQAIKSNLVVHEHVDKSGNLGVDRMGYHGAHYIISLGDRFSGTRYDDITTLKCEIQVRTILQDAWAMISRQLVYTEEETIPKPLQRDLNNVASLLEIAQGVFDSVRTKRNAYVDEIQGTKKNPVTFLAQAVDYETLYSYALWKFPSLQPSGVLTLILLQDLDQKVYRTLSDIDLAVDRATKAVSAYNKERPEVFSNSTVFITKSLGFTDAGFRAKHGFARATRDAFAKFAGLVKPKG